MTFKQWEGLPYGAGLASRVTVKCFLDWARDPRKTRAPPPRDQPMSSAQVKTWARAMVGTSQAHTLREVWRTSHGKMWYWLPETRSWFSRPWTYASCGDWVDPHSGRSVCCDFYINKCAIGDLYTRTHGPSPYGDPSFLPVPVCRYEGLHEQAGGPHGLLLALH